MANQEYLYQIEIRSGDFVRMTAGIWAFDLNDAKAMSQEIASVVGGDLILLCCMDEDVMSGAWWEGKFEGENWLEWRKNGDE